MKFEEVLPYIRKGNKILNKDYDKDGEYWMIHDIILFEPCKECGHEEGHSEIVASINRYDRKGFIQHNEKSRIHNWLIMSENWEVL